MHWETFKVEHAFDMVLNAVDSDFRENKYIEEWAIFNINKGPGYTVFHEGKMLGIAGIRVVRPGLGHAWAVFSNEIEHNIRTCFRTLKDSLIIIEEEYAFKKIRTLSRAGFPSSQRLIEHLGFKRVRYISKLNHYLYLRKI